MSDTQTNGVDPDLAKKYISKDDEAEAELTRLKMAYLQECKRVAEQRKTDLKMAVAEGLPSDAWRLELKLHRKRNAFARQIQNILADEESDTLEIAAMVREALGEELATLPLGAWAVERAEEETRAPKRKPGRPKKDAGIVVTITGEPVSGGGDALSSFAGDDEDVRPAFLKSSNDERRQAEAEERLGGLKAIN